MRRCVLVGLGLTGVLLLSACGADQSNGDDLVENLDFLNEGWSASPTAISMCTNLWPDTDGCLAFAEYLDGQACPIGAFTFGHLTLSDTGDDPLAAALAGDWADVGTRYGCEIDLVAFRVESG